MSQSLVKNLVHLVYSTKHRERTIAGSLRAKLYAYQNGIFAEWDSPAIVIEGTDDHVHALFALSKKHALIKIVEEVKKGSSKWMKTQGVERFYWQTGYAAFSVSESMLDTVRQYIKNQEKHHRRLSFQEELRALLFKHGIEFDERYVWD
ncbi:IS200/IS605 family transposase [Aeoliella sp. ICT_H6.2]|uniref:IS200/IS605 family transposase n=1 Tax=Aeoliella straminimaris TaxID=2954799 RepID=A0A9X2FB66_9BACT|nr:IS200/IS605 family transposase [Aeoliella straminimaris]MCO6045660.1 IS200/IS605 family transposase [Aeoliella straminimaris]